MLNLLRDIIHNISTMLDVLIYAQKECFFSENSTLAGWVREDKASQQKKQAERKRANRKSQQPKNQRRQNATISCIGSQLTRADKGKRFLLSFILSDSDFFVFFGYLVLLGFWFFLLLLWGLGVVVVW